MHHGWTTKKIFRSRTVAFFTFLSYWKTLDFHLVPEYFHGKGIVLKNCVKNHFEIFLIKLCWIPQKRIVYASIKTLQIELLPSSAANLFTLRSISHIKYSTLRKCPLLLNVLYHCQTIKFAVGTMEESLHTWFKDVFKNHSTQTPIWV